VVVHDQTRALREVKVVGELEREEIWRHGHLGPAGEQGTGGDAVPLAQPGALGRAPNGPRHLAAGHEREVGLDLVLPAGLEHLGERHAGGVNLDDDPLSRRERVRRLRLGEVDLLERGLRSAQVGDLHGAHGAGTYLKGLPTGA